MNKVPRALAALTLALVLAGCGSDGEQRTALDLIRDRAGATFGGGAEAPPDAREVLNADLLSRSPTSVLLVVIEKTDSGLTLVPIAANRGTVQWTDPDGGGLLTRDGLLVGTRGLGFDLMTADVAPLARALRAGGGQGVRRVNRVLDYSNRIVARTFLCDVVPVGRQDIAFYGRSYATTVFEERCSGDDGPAFTNRYWIERDGGIRRSIVHVTPEIGALTINRIVD